MDCITRTTSRCCRRQPSRKVRALCAVPGPTASCQSLGPQMLVHQSMLNLSYNLHSLFFELVCLSSFTKSIHENVLLCKKLGNALYTAPLLASEPYSDPKLICLQSLGFPADFSHNHWGRGLCSSKAHCLSRGTWRCRRTSGRSPVLTQSFISQVPFPPISVSQRCRAHTP